MMRRKLVSRYTEGRSTFIPFLLPELALKMSAEETLGILKARFGTDLERALSPERIDAHRPDGNWLKSANIVGINVRTVGSFWNVLKYVLTLPAARDSVHLLPIWEAGVVGSIYGMSSWELNPEFFSPELAQALPHLDSVERQLKAVINVIHLTGRTVGMDVIPHTDRYSEIVLAHPDYFEWLKRKELEIVDHRENLHQEAMSAIFALLKEQRPALEEGQLPSSREEFFAWSGWRKQRVLFGRPEDHAGRNRRRNEFVVRLHRLGLEPVPGTMAPPFRGLEVDPRDAAKTVDQDGLVWRDYRITEPEPMSRVFGPLTRYKLYERKDDNRNWEIDFDRPRKEVWDYVCRKYGEVQQRFGFDFMRGDMSHVQMRPAGVPDEVDKHYDLLAAVRHHVRQHGSSSFGYFGESFLAPPGVMAFGSEEDHLEACNADATLGDLQSTSVGSIEFMEKLHHYAGLAATRSFAPAFTVMTGDKDDPRFDEFYRKGAEVRLFASYFLTDMPGYVGLGYETRDVHMEPAPNEHYTKLYVFQERTGPKATRGPYVWGKNGPLFAAISRLRLFLDEVDFVGNFKGRKVIWLLPPDPSGEKKLVAWTLEGAEEFLLLANFDTKEAAREVSVPGRWGTQHAAAPELLISTASPLGETAGRLVPYGDHFVAERVLAGEGRIYRVGHERPK